MEKKWTPGPWEPSIVISQWSIDAHDSDKAIAECWGNGYDAKMSPEEVKANAHLMAASPTLYDELDTNLQMMENLYADFHAGRVLHRSAIEEGLRMRIVRTRAALAKARGES